MLAAVAKPRSRPQAGTQNKKPQDTYLGQPWAIVGRQATLYDRIEERKARRARRDPDA